VVTDFLLATTEVEVIVATDLLLGNTDKEEDKKFMKPQHSWHEEEQKNARKGSARSRVACALAGGAAIGTLAGLAVVGFASAVSTTPVLAFKGVVKAKPAADAVIAAAVNSTVATEMGAGFLGAGAGYAMGNDEGKAESTVVGGLSAATAAGTVACMAGAPVAVVAAPAILLSAAIGWCICKFW